MKKNIFETINCNPWICKLGPMDPMDAIVAKYGMNT